MVNEIRFTKLFGHVKKTELERIARNANHALLLNRKEQEQKVSIEMILKMEIKETALSVLEKTEVKCSEQRLEFYCFSLRIRKYSGIEFILRMASKSSLEKSQKRKINTKTS